MNRLKTRYLGLQLNSPVIVSSSPFTSTTANIVEAEKAGAGAVVLKSIFEEQILAEVDNTQSYTDYPEAADYLNTYITENSLSTYIQFIQETKKQVSIPIIASVNCNAGGNWVKFVRVIEDAGADAIELNIFHLPKNSNVTGAEMENAYLNTVAQVRDAITIPLTVKLAQGLTNPLNIAKEIYYRNGKGVTLFNRFYAPDINIETLSMSSGNSWSSPSEIHNVIRSVGMVASEAPLLDISASTGVRNGEDAVKLMLAGAKTIQICSAIHDHGFKVITQINNFISSWMKEKAFATTAEFTGKLSYDAIPDAKAYERTQFMKYFSSKEV